MPAQAVTGNTALVSDYRFCCVSQSYPQPALQGGFNGRLPYARSDGFGLNGATAGFAYSSALPNLRNPKGSTYFDLNYSINLGDQLRPGLHAGRATVRRYGELSHMDYKVSAGRPF